MNAASSSRSVKDAKKKKNPLPGPLMLLLVCIVLLLVFMVIIGLYIDQNSTNKASDYTNWVTAFSSILLAIITIVTLMENSRISQITIDIANKSLEETRLMREAQTEPLVLVRIQPREEWLNFIDMIIENVGPGPAYDVRFVIDPSMDELMGEKVSEMGFMKRGLNCMASKQKIQFFLTDVVERYEEKKVVSYQVHVTYKNALGKVYNNTYVIDFSELSGMSQLGTPPLYEMATALKGVESKLGDISSGRHRMKVIAYTTDDLEKEREDRKNRLAKQAKREKSEDGGKVEIAVLDHKDLEN